ncbi:MAG: nicotinate-nucleotide diphosphorylase (carboxylating) [Bacteroidetes bacterium GWA2_31_9]|nr:MAG: nicotinate-nucleotide diphosphorylase (carboxylating) [Bacteroidetes bacterium GWA2_31_9]
MNNQLFDKLIELAILEDFEKGDHTSLATVPSVQQGKAKLIVKQNGIIAGIEIAQKVFSIIDNSTELKIFIQDGTNVKIGDIAFEVYGKTQSILKSERLILNIMQRMSGIATTTNTYVEKIKQYKTKILDTRKTTPGFRLFEKEAVRIGGGVNHRMGLYDMIMIKDNHIDYAGGIEKAIDRTNEYLQKNNLNLKIEIEARNLNDVNAILKHGGVNIIMLDNFNIENTLKAVRLIIGKYQTESSGGITIDTIVDYAACGVDFISIGALTHHVSSIDLSLKAF